MATQGTPFTNISGIASGLDTNTMISQLIALRKQPAVALGEQISLANTRKSGLQSASNLLAALKSAAQALTSSDLWASQQALQVSDTNTMTANRTALTAPGGYTVNILGLARAEQQRSAAGFTGVAADDTLHIKVGSGTTKDVQLKAGDTIDQVVSKINAVSGMGVYASAINGTLYLSGKTTGASNSIQLTSDGSTSDDLGMTISSSAADAQYKINGGATQNSASNTVKDAVPGMTFVFKQTGTTTATLGDVQSSASDIADKIQALVDAYNSAAVGINGQLTTKPVSKPTSSADKLVGSLFNDNNLQSVISNMRSWYSHQVTGTSGSALDKLGIKPPGAGTTTMAGPPKLTFDRQAFLDAYASDPESVKSLVTNYTNQTTTEGVGQWVMRQIDGLTGKGGVLDNAINGLGNQVKLYSDRQTRINDRAAIYESTLRSQFTHMETILSGLQSQNSQLVGQINKL